MRASASSVRTIGKAVLAATALLVFLSVCEAADLPLVRVVLSTAGLAQFTYAGAVAGGSSVDLTVRLDQVDDVLKSLTVFDRASGVGAVTLPGKAPLAELFRDLPFGPDALNSPAALLNALVGAEVEIAGPVSAKGRIFRVEPEKTALPNNGGTVERHRLSLMTDRGIVQAVLEDLTTLRFADAQAQAQLDRALSGLIENRAKDRRLVSIGFLGEGTRTVAVSYTAAAPVWKTAYRLVLPKTGDKARLQGWAVLENMTGGDWKDVDLVLVSGNPVALHQSLYTAFFAERPEVPVETAARVVPRVDDADEPSPPRKSASLPPPAAAPAPHRFAAKAAGPGDSAAPGGVPYSADTIGASAQAAAAEEGATQVLYRFPAKLSLASGHTMMVPFVDRETTATRTWLYQPATSLRHPLAAVRLRNDGEGGLPAGIVTAYEVSAEGTVDFVGDARLPLLSKGAAKFVTFALDVKTAIRREDKGVARTVFGKAVDGTLTLTVRSRHAIDYEITAPPDEDREIVVEESRVEGWKPIEADTEETPSSYRRTVAVPKGKTVKASLVVEHVDGETVMLADLDAEQMLARIVGLQNESPQLKDAIARLGAIVGEINQARARRAQLAAERKKIADDQARIRGNLQSVGRDTDLGRRYIDTLGKQEARLAEIDRLDQELEAGIAAKRQAAVELAKRLTL